MSLFPHHAPDQTPESSLRWGKRLSVQRYRRLCARLIGMGPAEISTRVWMRARKTTTTLGHRYGLEWQPARLGTDSFLTYFQASPQVRMTKLFNERFFFGPCHQNVIRSHLEAHFSCAAHHIIKTANALGEQGIDLLGQRVRLVPGEIDWQADPRTQRRAWPDGVMEEGAAIGVTDADVKYVWELNRHQFLTFLGRAFWLTDNPRYASQAVALVDDWITKNPFGRGVNWSSHLEVAVRAISWLWTMPYVLAWSKLDSGFLEHWLKSLADHYHHLSKHLSVYTDPTNHLIGEATALWMLSVVFPDLPGASQQGRRTLNILTREIERQITPDGVNREQATSYHRFVLDFYLQVVVLARRLGEPLPAIIEQRVQAMLDFVAALGGDQGVAPMIGDSDDARGIPFPELSGWDFRDLLSTGSVLFERSDWKQLSGGLAEVTVWLLGVDAIGKYDLLSREAAPSTSRVFTQGGYCFFNASGSQTQLELIFDVGPLGLWPNAAHGHADALSILIRLNGKFLLADPGTGTYFGSRLIRDAFRHSAAHNTLTVDSLDQADIYDTFKWVNPMNVELLESFVGEHFDYARATQDGYCRLRKPIKHYRSVLFVRPSEWIIIDHLEGKGEHLFTRHFNFPPGINLQRDGSHGVFAVDQATGAGLRFVFPEGDGQAGSSLLCDVEGGWSERYGQWEKAPRMKVDTYGSAPLTLFTFISPDAGPTISTPGTSQCYTELLAGGHAVVCRRVTVNPVDRFEDIVLVNPLRHDVSLLDVLHSNAGFLFLRRLNDGAIERAFLAGKGQCLFKGGMRLACKEDDQFAAFIQPATCGDRKQ